MDNSSNILVTGGGGFLGKAIVRKLIARGERIRSFSRNFYPVLDNLNVEQVQGDISDASAVASACEGIDTVFHVPQKQGSGVNTKVFIKPMLSVHAT